MKQIKTQKGINTKRNKYKNERRKRKKTDICLALKEKGEKGGIKEKKDMKNKRNRRIQKTKKKQRASRIRKTKTNQT